MPFIVRRSRGFSLASSSAHLILALSKSLPSGIALPVRSRY
jgi:hypothetical protein